MDSLIIKDLEQVINNKILLNMGASFFIYGSSVRQENIDDKFKDVDIAILISPEKKTDAVYQLCKLAKEIDRKMNWAIDVYNFDSPSFGYNRRTGSPIHFFIIDNNELNSNSKFTISLKKYYRKISQENIK